MVLDVGGLELVRELGRNVDLGFELWLVLLPSLLLGCSGLDGWLGLGAAEEMLCFALGLE